jgi:DNA polymerase III delta prime subunit
MNRLEKLIPDNLYHSYIIEGDIKENTSLVCDLIKNRGYSLEDSFAHEYDAFSIPDVEALREWHNRKRLDNEKRFCVLGAKFINHDAERAFLKMIEEPGSGTHFFILVPDTKLLLDTIISRSHIIKPKNQDKDNLSDEANRFFKASVKDRMDMIALVIKKNENNEDSGGLRHNSISILEGLEYIIYARFKKSPKDKNNIKILEEISKAKGYLSIPGSSPKMILEHIALVI